MTYTSKRPPLTESSDQLRARIPGWGADLDPKDRPSVPKLRWQEDRTGAHWEFPERQPERGRRERSIEHKFLTPVFGTSCPPRGLSGVLRRLSYRKYSEGRAAHWLLLLAADRVDAWEHHARSFLTLRPDNPITETGVLSEFSRHGVSSRLGKKRADVKHQMLDPVIVAGPWVAVGGLVFGTVRKVLRRSDAPGPRGARRRRSS
ncbi:hypothetical protein LWP59_17400 [Amycolatopsis acidiphila]|uniref:Uncharacterized protein n=1 Tax=Amycolatopsis acidiphila TaxID=715473 RepID=A0A558AP32_9PSEU|nr:hypothetical protein [Amycolatopsis acidiphila]TVT26002.1 hypothetical protein FNH06_00820 [Amycolatopsis acidiphila]UIJ63283.1 hypothetical protein LWP59_17400 [Amycolatopsis acidiphila]GHG74777.1 hypothetical protein GCM10017788_39030 [Amycolatopsis acidiphila]